MPMEDLSFIRPQGRERAGEAHHQHLTKRQPQSGPVAGSFCEPQQVRAPLRPSLLSPGNRAQGRGSVL